MPSVDRDLVSFFSQDPLDKVVQQGEVSITNDGDTTASGTGTGSQTAKIVEDTETNNYGRASFARARWSIDGGSNWQSLESELIYTFDLTITDIPVTQTLSALQAAISIGCTDSTITFRTANGDHGDQSRTSGQANNVGYTPTSHTFVIQYVLYERE